MSNGPDAREKREIYALVILHAMISRDGTRPHVADDAINLADDFIRSLNAPPAASTATT